MNHRPERVSNLIRDELAALILREVEFPGFLTTITEVVTDAKLETARVRVSIIPNEKAEEALGILNTNRGRLQFELHHKINIKPMPHISFEIDPGPTNAARVEKLLLDQ